MQTFIKLLILLPLCSLLLSVNGRPLATSSSSSPSTLTSTATSTATSIAFTSSSTADSLDASSSSSESTLIEELKSYAKTAATIPFSAPTPSLYFPFSGSGCPHGVKLGEMCCYGDVVNGKCLALRPGDQDIVFVNETVTRVADRYDQWVDSNNGLIDLDYTGSIINSAVIARGSLPFAGIFGAVATLGGWI